MTRRMAWMLGLALAAGAGAAMITLSSAARAEKGEKGDKAAKPDETARTERAEESTRRLERDAERIHRRVVRRLHLDGDGGYLGVTLEDVGRDDVTRLKLGEERGARVASVIDDTPAASAGLKADDVIVEYQGEPVRGVMQLRRLVRETPPGRSVSLEVVRDGHAQQLSVELGGPERARFDVRVPEIDIDLPPPEELAELGDVPEPPDAPEPPAVGRRGRDRLMLRHFAPLLDFAQPRRLGLRYQEISGQLASYFKLEDDRGVLVVEVDEGGPAAQAGLAAGDVVLSVGGKQVREGSDLRAALSGTDAGQEVDVKVWREGRPLDLKVKLGGRERRSRGTT